MSFRTICFKVSFYDTDDSIVPYCCAMLGAIRILTMYAKYNTVMTLLCMECPNKLDGPTAGEKIRDEKVRVLEAMQTITLDDVFLGQYEGYTDDETITNKDTNCPTFAMIRCFINNQRWAGVPIIFKAGKALDERKAEMRVQFKDAPAADALFGEAVPRNELVMQLQPKETMYMKSNIKTPGFGSAPIQSELEVKYDTRYFNDGKSSNPDAYSRLILDVLRGRSASFVRSDELIRAWEIFTPVLHQIEAENVRPHTYKMGSRGVRSFSALLLVFANWYLHCVSFLLSLTVTI